MTKLPLSQMVLPVSAPLAGPPGQAREVEWETESA